RPRHTPTAPAIGLHAQSSRRTNLLWPRLDNVPGFPSPIHATQAGKVSQVPASIARESFLPSPEYFLLACFACPAFAKTAQALVSCRAPSRADSCSPRPAPAVSTTSLALLCSP